jgi:aminoglycoside phosphotransferase (APT) family kinase protein
MSDRARHMSDQLGASAALAGKLDALLVRLGRGNLRKDSLERLTGGASQETWAFDAVGSGGTEPLIMRRLSGDVLPSDNVVGPEYEARLIRRAGECGVPTPGICHILETGDDLGRGFLSDRIEGETLARRILRNPEFAEIRPRLGFQCGAILARVHAVPLDGLPPLKTRSAAGQLDELYESYQSFGGGSAVFEVAFRWLRDHVPGQTSIPRLIHGDFRNGNLIVGPEGVRAVLDWELAHLGDPAEDLGWITVNSWRFGAIDKPVGGFGRVEEMLDGYRSEGGEAIDVERVLYWRTLGSLRWGLICRRMARPAQPGMPVTVERAMIGRRISETELDLLDILASEGVG